MYLIVRESLGMGVGKIAAQCAHAAQMLTIKFWELGNSERERFAEQHTIGHQEQDFLQIFSDWLNTSFRKVVLRANDKEWIKLKEIPNHIVVVDSGLTEVAPNSETVIGLWPMLKSQRTKALTKLQALK